MSGRIVKKTVHGVVILAACSAAVHLTPVSCLCWNHLTHNNSRSASFLFKSKNGNGDNSSYSSVVAYNKRDDRIAPHFTEPNAVTEELRGVTSLITFPAGIGFGAIAAMILSPSILLARQQSPVSHSNRSLQSGGSRTAILALWARSQAYLQGSGGPDYLAPRLLENILKSLSQEVVGLGSILLLCAQLSRVNFRVTRECFEDQVAYLFTLCNTGLVTPLHVRTCWLDDVVTTFVNQYSDANLVLLGSGFDTRCYRMELQGINAFEVDAPGTMSEKQRVLEACGVDFSKTALLTCDFETKDWLSALLYAGMDTSLPTLVILEGVTMYLDRQVIIDALEKVSKKPSWYIAFDYINSSWAMSFEWKNAMKNVGEPFKFAMTPPTEPQRLTESVGLEMVEHLWDPKELADRYLPKHFSGRSVGILDQYGGFIVAKSPK